MHFDNSQGRARSAALLRALADRFRVVGYNGVTVLARNCGVIAGNSDALRADRVNVYFAPCDGKFAEATTGADDDVDVDSFDTARASTHRNTVTGVPTMRAGCGSDPACLTRGTASAPSRHTAPPWGGLG